MHTPHRERRPWTPQEDEMLRAAVSIEEPGNPNPSKWFAIAQRVPGRTNKDCRKRWFAKMTSNIVKGIWSPEEDQKLLEAIEKHGTRWSIVASCVHTRNSDQCAKRWTDTLDPSIVRSIWSPEDDQILIDAVNDHGTAWTKIVRLYFPGRTGLSAKNRYASLMRSHHLHQRTRPPSRSRASNSASQSRRPQSQSHSIILASQGEVGRSGTPSQSSESDLPLNLIPFPYSTTSSSSHSQHSHSHSNAAAVYGGIDPSDEDLLALLSPPMTTDHSRAQPQAFTGSSFTSRIPSEIHSHSKTPYSNYTNGRGQPNNHLHPEQYDPNPTHYYSTSYSNVATVASSQTQMSDMTDITRIKHEIPEISAQVLRHADDYWAQWN